MLAIRSLLATERVFSLAVSVRSVTNHLMKRIDLFNETLFVTARVNYSPLGTHDLLTVMFCSS